MSYWNLLEDDLKDKVKTLKANDDSHSLEEIINILIKVDDKSLDCVEVNAEKLELLLNKHPNLYTQGQDNPVFLEKISDEFDDLKKQFATKNGADGYERCPLGTYCLNFIDDDFTTKLKNNDLMGIIKKYQGHAPALTRLICQTPKVLTQEMLRNADSNGQTPLMWVAKYGYTDIVKRMLEKTDDLSIIDAIDKNGATPLVYAAGMGHTDIVELILEKTNNLDVIALALRIAKAKNYIGIVKLILEKKIKLLILALILAMFMDRIDTARLVLECTDDLAIINVKDGNGRTPLMSAASNGHTDIVKLILEKTDDLAVINAKDKSGKTPLMCAISGGHADIVTLLQDKVFEQEAKINNALLSKLALHITGLYKKNDKNLRSLIASLEKLQEIFTTSTKMIPMPKSLQKQKAEQAILQKTNTFLDAFLDDTKTANEKIKVIIDYENAIYPYRKFKTICKWVGVIIASALCATTGAAIGLGIGALAGAWSGPGAIVTAFVGMFSGAATAWTVGVTVGAGLAGTTGLAVASYYAFFKPAPPIHQAVGEVLKTARYCAVN